MALAGAEIALGIEPFLLFNYQFQAMQTLINVNHLFDRGLYAMALTVLGIVAELQYCCFWCEWLNKVLDNQCYLWVVF
jgi:hypothetical protein